MPPEVIAVGETQERLLWVLPPHATADVLRIYNDEYTLPQVAFNARAVVVGRVTSEQRYVLRHRGAIVMDVESEFLTGRLEDELPYVEAIRHEPVVGRTAGSRRRERVSARSGASRRVLARAAFSAIRLGRARRDGHSARRGRRRRTGADSRKPARAVAGGSRKSALRQHRCRRRRAVRRSWKRCGARSRSARARSA